MTVRELMKALIDCNPDATVIIEIESDRNSLYSVEYNFMVSKHDDFVVIREAEE